MSATLLSNNGDTDGNLSKVERIICQMTNSKKLQAISLTETYVACRGKLNQIKSEKTDVLLYATNCTK